MCLGEVARIESVDDQTAEVLTTNGLRQASLVVLTGEGHEAAPGDWIIISMGFALDIVGESEARELLLDAALVKGEPDPALTVTEVFQ
jgi:hydrogenase maturation factor